MNLPANIIAEKEILCTAILKQDALFRLMEYSENIFFTSENRAVFLAMQSLFNADEKIDLTTLRTVLNDKLGNYLIDLIQSNTVVNIDYVLNDLYHKQLQRELMFISQDLYKTVQSGDISYIDFIEKIIEIHEKINAPKLSECTTMSAMTELDLDEIFNSHNYIKTKIHALDDGLIGLFNGQLVVIAAPPGCGKTTLAFQIACNIENSLFISLEMKRNELYAKLLSRYSGVNSMKIEGKTLADDDVIKLLKAKDDIKKEINITVYDFPLPFLKIMSTIRKHHKQKKINVVVIDYLQLIEGLSGENREEKISKLTRSLKLLAGELNIPIICLSQLTKDVLKEGRAPTLGDLRGSGAIGQDADVVIFLYEDKNNNNAILIGKGRKGPTGKLSGIYFNKNYSRFENIETRYGDCQNPDYFNN
jgi:replicative DNA helicase